MANYTAVQVTQPWRAIKDNLCYSIQPLYYNILMGVILKYPRRYTELVKCKLLSYIGQLYMEILSWEQNSIYFSSQW